jgi:copper homeostasis protein
MELEIIASTVEDALNAERGGATRIELCVDLEQDGLTPPLSLVTEVVAAVRIPVRVMLRRRNDFTLEDEGDLQWHCDTARIIEQMGADGVVLGFVQDGRVNEAALQRITAAAPQVKITFHRAFDVLEDPFTAIDALKRFPQVDCILTSGGAGDWPQRAQQLITLQQRASPAMKILVGGGVTEETITWLCQHTPLHAFHAGRAARENHRVSGRVLEQNVCLLSDAIHQRREKRDS